MTARYSLFIDGEATQAADGRSETIVAPATEEAIAEVPVGGAEDVERAVAAAATAFESWGGTPRGKGALSS